VSCGLASGNALGFVVDMVLAVIVVKRTKGSLPLTGLARPLVEKEKSESWKIFTKSVILFQAPLTSN
jgi:hypothetical protein